MVIAILSDCTRTLCRPRCGACVKIFKYLGDCGLAEDCICARAGLDTARDREIASVFAMYEVDCPTRKGLRYIPGESVLDFFRQVRACARVRVRSCVHMCVWCDQEGLRYVPAQNYQDFFQTSVCVRARAFARACMCVLARFKRWCGVFWQRANGMRLHVRCVFVSFSDCLFDPCLSVWLACTCACAFACACLSASRLIVCSLPVSASPHKRVHACVLVQAFFSLAYQSDDNALL